MKATPTLRGEQPMTSGGKETSCAKMMSFKDWWTRCRTCTTKFELLKSFGTL
ncbi:hypothetical protein ACS0TY_007290 [Phlomoides rotata]